MIPNLPAFISLFFGITTLVTLYLLYKASSNSKITLWVCLIWLLLQAGIGWSGFYLVVNTMPPRFGLAIIPPFTGILILFFTKKGRAYIDSLNIKILTVLHTVRVPVEIVLYWLFLHQLVPQLMTFEGRNFDILAGLTAPVVFYFGFVKKALSRMVMLGWNILSLGLLLNIVINAILSSPVPFQQFAFEQPNIGVLYFPFVWLPSFIVPTVLLAHLAAIRQLIVKSE